MTKPDTSFGSGNISLWDYAVTRVVTALKEGTHEGERVALSWEGNVSFDAFKLLEAARKQMKPCQHYNATVNGKCNDCGKPWTEGWL